VPFCGVIDLAAYSVADVFDCFADFPAGFAEAFFHVAGCVISTALSFEVAVIENFPSSFFDFTFGLIPFAFHFVSIR
jgi:hypothetical protein